jgi:hypothetical protein
LRWHDLNLETGHLTLNQVVESVCKRWIVFKLSKSATSRRTIRLPRAAIERLRQTRGAIRGSTGGWPQLIAQGAPTKAISERAGNAGIQITINCCGHLLPGVEDQMIERFDMSLQQATEPQRASDGSSTW